MKKDIKYLNYGLFDELKNDVTEHKYFYFIFDLKR